MTAKILAHRACVCATALMLGLPATAAEKISQQLPSAEACTRTINAMGASMGNKADTAPDGRPIYRFVVRTNGLDYDAVCDAATGVVSDVTPRMTH